MAEGSAFTTAKPVRSELDSRDPCWGCGADPQEDMTFDCCGRCSDSGYAVCARFCTLECQQENWPRHKKWHKKRDAEIKAGRVPVAHNNADITETIVEREAAAKTAYERMCSRSDQEMQAGNAKGALKLANRATVLEPDDPRSYFSLGNAYTSSRDFLRASEAYLDAVQRCAPDTNFWAICVTLTWGTRGHAAPCGSGDPSCDCEECAALPETPAWMRSPQLLVAMAVRVVAADPNNPRAWSMHAMAHDRLGDWSTAARSHMRVAKLYGDLGSAPDKEIFLQNARWCLAKLRE